MNTFAGPKGIDILSESWKYHHAAFTKKTQFTPHLQGEVVLFLTLFCALDLIFLIHRGIR